MESAKKYGKRVIAHPEHNIPVVSVWDWVSTYIHDPKDQVIAYIRSLFPILTWISRYNLTWLTGDVIAGFTVGIVVVPQGMSYAKIATLSPEYGLYSSFVGVLIYCFFATSKDVSIGPVAVMSLTVAHMIADVDAKHPGEYEGHVIASAIALICGFIVLGLGLLRLGWVVEFIPAPAVSAFMTGSALNIVAGQVPGLMGISGFSTRANTWIVIINTLKGLPRTDLDAAWGLPSLVALYGIRIGCDALGRRYPRRERFFFFVSVCRNAFVLLVMTVASWLYTRHRKDANGDYPITILGTVPAGFQDIGQPFIDSQLLSAIAPELPVATIILLLEHIAIAKSFGRVNGYTINPNQELIAIGVTNTVGSCFGAYPATGSFSRSALKSKCGVRTPAAGILTAVVVIVALYGCTPAFYWIPSAALSAVIIHAVANLVTPPKQVYAFIRASPIEAVIWFAGVIVSVFGTIEDGIYTTICVSVALLLVRVAMPRGHFLGRVRVEGARDHVVPSDAEITSTDARDLYVPLLLPPSKTSIPAPASVPAPISSSIPVTPPAPGVILYRFEESAIYPNIARLNVAVVACARATTRRGQALAKNKGDRPWNDAVPSVDEEEEAKRPRLHALVLDFGGVAHVDVTAVQALVDTRSELERWAGQPVTFHFASIRSPWIRRALIAGGFGYRHDGPTVPSSPPKTQRDLEVGDGDEEEVSDDGKQRSRYEDRLWDPQTPFFHVDLPAAVAAAEGVRPLMSPVQSSSSSSEIRREGKRSIEAVTSLS
ncbi:sulfate permease [Fistulina hepatica ATCC 64428]|uniref:Sulfate permease n=1 Tax=Fistulina hepatica ATCC 64428 TaxID=1128425 RepID=A0A0D7A651_9AGAR|nr:sulfate permease [Fistulina hepatica ATCC 64428]